MKYCKYTHSSWFYDNLILSGTKMSIDLKDMYMVFYDNLILSGTKIGVNSDVLSSAFYDNLILSGTKIA